MALEYSVALRNARLLEIQTVIGSAGLLKIFSGAEPPNCGAPDPSGLLLAVNLPFPFITVNNGSTILQGNWNGNTIGVGTCQCFRMYDASNNCHVQGSIPNDMVVTPSASVVVGQPCQVVTFSVTAGNP